jgi:hypothetical protein
MVTYLTSCPKLIGLMVENHNNISKSRFKPRTFLPMNTDSDHLDYLTVATPAAEGGVDICPRRER